MRKGRILILVGGSSAGKTSLAQALQSTLDDLYLLMGIDLFWCSLPPKQLDLDKVDPEYYSWRMEQLNGEEIFRILPGPILDELMIGRYYAIAQYLDRGFNIIADEVIWKRLWLDECLKSLDSYEATFIKVFCSDEVASKREIERGDRHVGWNRGSAYYSDLDCLYDLEVDTTHNTSAECAENIKSALSSGFTPNAYSKMKEQLTAK